MMITVVNVLRLRAIKDDYSCKTNIWAGKRREGERRRWSECPLQAVFQSRSTWSHKDQIQVRGLNINCSAPHSPIPLSVFVISFWEWIYSGDLTLKFHFLLFSLLIRQPTQDAPEEVRARDFRRELEERERVAAREKTRERGPRG